MAKIKIDASTAGTGTFTISAPNSNTDRTLTLPDTTAALVTTASPDFTGDVTFDTSTLVIDSTNNRVGIGTTSPVAPLHVQHSAVQTPFIVANRYNDNSVYPNYKPIFAVTEADIYSTGTTETVIGNHNRTIRIGPYFDNTGTAAAANGLTIMHTSGNVGIGESNPTTNLDVTGAIVASQSYRIGDISHWKIRGNNANVDLGFEYSTSSTLADANIKMVLKSSGNVGIGTQSPSTKLHVVGSLMAESTSGTGNAWTYYKNTDRTWLVGIRGSASDILSFYDLTTDAQRMAIDSSGHVTMPYQPAFQARPPTSYSISNDTIFTSGFTAVYDQNSDFDTSTGKFTAPVDGVYIFNVRIFCSGGSWNRQDTLLDVNGSIAHRMEQQKWGTNGSNNAVGMTCCVRISEGDYVRCGVRISSGTTYQDQSPFGEFSGYLLG